MLFCLLILVSVYLMSIWTFFLTFVWICISLSFCGFLLSCNTDFHEVVFSKNLIFIYLFSIFFFYTAPTYAHFTSLLAVFDILCSINTPHMLLFSVFETRFLFKYSCHTFSFHSLFFSCPFLILRNNHKPPKVLWQVSFS